MKRRMQPRLPGRLFVLFGLLCFVSLFFDGSKETLAGSPPAVSPKAFAPVPSYVFLISIDGWAYRHLWDKRLSMPAIRRLARSGSWGHSRTVFPSMTWPSHATIVSGLMPRRHGVIGNRWYNHKMIMLPHTDNIEKRRKTATLYDLAFAAGMSPAAVMWPGTQGALTLPYNIPELTRKWLVRKYVKGPIRNMICRSRRYSFKHVHHAMRPENDHTDRLTQHLTLRLLRKKQGRPKMFLVHYLGLDHALHVRGGGHHHVMKHSMKKIDSYIGELVAETKRQGIYHKSTFVIVSDHGFADVKWSVDIRHMLIRARLSRRYSLNSRLARREKVIAFANGHAAHIYFPRAKRGTKAYKKLRSRVIRVLKKNKFVETVFLPNAYHSLGLPTPKENKASPDLIALTRVNAYFGYNSRGRVVARTQYTGAHGYLPGHPSMWVPYVAAGAGIRVQKKAVPAHNVDIAPTIAHLLQLEWPVAVDGKILYQILRPHTRQWIARAKQARQLARQAKSKKKRRLSARR